MASSSAAGERMVDEADSGSRFGGINLSAMRAAASDALSRAATSETWERARSAASELSARAAAARAAARERLSREPVGGLSRSAQLTPVQREAAFSNLLQQASVPYEPLRRLCFADGVPDGMASTPRLRAIAWKLMLGYLPPDRSEWAAHLKAKREIYASWRQELTIDPHAKELNSVSSMSEGHPLDGFPRYIEDHPLVAAVDDRLASSAASAGKEWQADQNLRLEIQKDVDRTLPQYMFFCKERPRGRLHAEAIGRMLFLYAKLNPGIRYVQGMNELVAPIYYAFCAELEADAGMREVVADFFQGLKDEEAGESEAGTDEAQTSATSSDAEVAFRGSFIKGRSLCGVSIAQSALQAVEADAFFCFTALMSEVRDHFCSKLDYTELGISARIARFDALLRSKDSALAAALDRLGVAPTFYAFRWISLLMTQELDLPDVLRLWDSLFADPQRFELLLYFCVAMVMAHRALIMSAPDFATALKGLQSFDGRVPLHELLARSIELYTSDTPKKRGAISDEADAVLGEIISHARDSLAVEAAGAAKDADTTATSHEHLRSGDASDSKTLPPSSKPSELTAIMSVRIPRLVSTDGLGILDKQGDCTLAWPVRSSPQLSNPPLQAMPPTEMAVALPQAVRVVDGEKTSSQAYGALDERISRALAE